jgi:hypothetical protein
MKKESTDDEKWERITWYVLSNVQTGRMSLVDAQETLDLCRKDELKTLHQELQKARQDWLREEIVKLEGMKYIQVVDDDVTEAMNDTIQTIIDRHQVELTTLTPKT